MSIQKKIAKRTLRRVFRTRNMFKSKGLKPRVSVYRSLNHIYVQAIDDATGVTLASFSSLALKGEKANKKDISRKVGLEFAKRAKEKSVSEVFFDRGRYKYHGRVASLADGLREAGLKF